MSNFVATGQVMGPQAARLAEKIESLRQTIKSKGFKTYGAGHFYYDRLDMLLDEVEDLVGGEGWNVTTMNDKPVILVGVWVGEETKA